MLKIAAAIFAPCRPPLSAARTFAVKTAAPLVPVRGAGVDCGDHGSNCQRWVRDEGPGRGRRAAAFRCIFGGSPTGADPR